MRKKNCQRQKETVRLRGLFTNVRRAVTGVAETLLDQASSFGEIDGDTTASGCSAAALAALRVPPDLDTQQRQSGGDGLRSTGHAENADKGGKSSKADKADKGGEAGSSTKANPDAEATTKTASTTRNARRDSSVPGK